MTGDRSPERLGARQCTRTGLRLVPVEGRRVVRIAKPSYGPLNPPLRQRSPTDVDAWGRWDTPNGRTIYAVETTETAYREVLAYLAPAVGLRNLRLADAFIEDEDAEGDPRTLLDAIATEWDKLWKVTPSKVVAGWRGARRVYVLTLPQEGWVVDVQHQESVDALNRGLAQQLAREGVARLTAEHLFGEERLLTVAAAQWIRSQVLDDGSLPHGITFSSKHGTNGGCWTVWLRNIDDGHDPSRELIKVITCCEIHAPDRNPELKSAVDAFGLIIL